MSKDYTNVFTIDDGVSIYTNENKFFPKVFTFTKVQDGAFISDHMGFMVEREDVVELIDRLQVFVDEVTEEDIKFQNDKLLNKLNEPRVHLHQKETYKVKSGYIYLIKADNGLIKIGKSTDLKTRLDHFTTKLPYEVELLHSIETNDYTKLEKELHDSYDDKRKRGEWFELSDDDINEIKKHYRTTHDYAI